MDANETRKKQLQMRSLLYAGKIKLSVDADFAGKTLPEAGS